MGEESVCLVSHQGIYGHLLDPDDHRSLRHVLLNYCPMVRILLKKYINSFITDNQDLDILYGGANIGLPRWLGVLAIAPPCDNYLIFSFFLAHSEKELVACVHAQ